MQHFHEWVWLDRDLTRIWMCRIERCTQWLHSVHSCCAFALMLSKYCTFLLVFAHLCKIWRVYVELSWVSMIRSGFDTHQNVQNRKMYAMVTLCTFFLRFVLWCCQIIEQLLLCLHTFVKYEECMQHFHEWVWLDRDLTRIWMCRIERCTQWLHSVHSCCSWCSDVFKILHISIVFAHLCKIWRVYAALSWVSMIRSGFDTHLNVQNRKMYAMVTLCTFLLRLVLWRFQNTAHFYCVCTPL